jgi:Kef-type K+ transport system membrane component KefB
MTGLTVLLAAAALAYGINRLLRISSIPLMVLAGVGAAYTGVVSERLVEDLVVLGVTFLVFLAGTELNPYRIGDQRGPALRIGLTQFMLLAGTGFAASAFLGFNLLEAFYLGPALAASSTLVVVRMLQRSERLFDPFGRLLLGVLLVQDVIVMGLIPLYTLLPAGGTPLAIGFGGLLLMAVGARPLQRRLVPYLLMKVARDQEQQLLIVLAVLALFLSTAGALGLPLVAGAFLAGVALSSFPVSGLVRGQLATFSDFFLAILFTGFGALVRFPSLLEFVQGMAFVLLLILITIPTVTWLMERAGHPARAGLEGGLLLAQGSEFSLVVGLHGFVLGALGEGAFTVITLFTVFSMMLTPLLAGPALVRRLLRVHPRRYRAEEDPLPEGHIVLLGCGETGMALLETLIGMGQQVVVVDDDPTVIERLREAEIPCYRGDAGDRGALRRAGIQQAKAAIALLRHPGGIMEVLEAAGDVPVLVSTFDEEATRLVTIRGDVPVDIARLATDDFLNWFDTQVSLR